MMTNPLDSFPDEWLVTAKVKRGGGKDDRGNPVPATTITFDGCLYAPKSSSDPVDRSSVPTVDAVLFLPPGSVIKSTDIITIPQGTFAVDGRPAVWPLGVEVTLKEEVVG